MTDDATEVVVVETEPDTVEVLLTNTEIITVNEAIPGPRGPVGPKGDPGNYVGISIDEVTETHVQNVATNTWEFTYSLPYTPTVTIVDSAGSTVEGEVQYAPNNIVRIKFAVAFSGTAYLS